MDQDLLIVSPILAFLAYMGIRLFWPKRGVEHAYRNWMHLQVLILIIGGLTIPALTMFIIVTWFLGEEYDNLSSFLIAASIVGFLAFVVVFLRERVNPIVQGLRWLRKHYPAVAQAIERYEQEGDERDIYFPACIVDGKPYFMIGYYDADNPGRFSGILLMDQEGTVLANEALLDKVSRCRTLAMDTVDYRRREEAAKNIADYRRALRALPHGSRLLRKYTSRFQSLGPRYGKYVQQLIEVEQSVALFLQAVIEQNLAIARWAASHGLGRLFQVSFDDVLALEKEISTTRQPVMAHLARLEAAAGAARRLLKAVPKAVPGRERRLLRAYLESLSILGKGITEETRKDYTLSYLTEDDLRAFRERTQYALELERQARAAEASP
jgi:hypothetical protein